MHEGFAQARRHAVQAAGRGTLMMRRPLSMDSSTLLDFRSRCHTDCMQCKRRQCTVSWSLSSFFVIWWNSVRFETDGHDPRIRSHTHADTSMGLVDV